MTVVLCSRGYPGYYKKNLLINDLEKVEISKNEIIYHAGTKLDDKNVLSNGGRVLNFTSTDRSFLNARKKIIKMIKTLNWKHGFFRRDIGRRVIDK